VGFLDAFAHRLGYTPLTAELGEAYASRFSDNSHLADITLEDWLGALPDYVAITRKNAMTVGTVGAARQVYAGTNGRLPIYTEKDGVRARSINASLFDQPERGTPRSTTMMWTYDALFFHPCTWWHVLERDFYGWPIWVEWVSHDRATTDSDGLLIQVDRKPVKPADVIRFDSPLGDGFLRNAKRDIQRAIALNLSASLAEDNPVPTVELHNEAGVPLTDEQREKLVSDWSASRRKRGVAYTPKGLKVIAHGQAPQQLLIDGRRAISLDLIRHANLPAWAASTAVEGATMTYDNRSLRNWELIDLSFASFHAAIDDRLSMPDVTPRGWRVRTSVDDLTKPDEKTRFETYAIGKSNGFIDNAWIAEREGWATVPTEETPA
jgi:hypothetical protein